MKRNIIILLLVTIGFFQGKATNDSLTVYIFLSETCPICQNQTYSLRQLYEQFKEKSVGFIGVFPNQMFSTKETIDRFKKKYKLLFPLQKDENQVLTDSFGATITPQVIVIQHNTNKIPYKGKIDNSYESLGKRRPVITEFYLRDALQEIISGKNVTLSETTPVGCYIVK